LSGLKMPLEIKNKPLIVIIGPTAVGKTELAIHLARRMNGEIISADSRLFYRGMDIGTAKPSKEEMGGVPHHLVDVADPDEIWSLATFQKRAGEIIEDIQKRQKLPFLVGGTGQYIHAVVDGWEIPAQEANHPLRKVLDDWAKEIGSLSLFEKLQKIDPEAASHIEYQNVRRTIRALEVIFLTGRKFSEQRTKRVSPYHVLMIGLKRSRPALYERIDRRIEQMISDGLVDEVKMLMDKGFAPHLPSLSAIGYRESVSYLQGTLSLEEAVVQMKRLTRQFVRRQSNWFKENDPQIHWFDMEEGVTDKVETLIRTSFL
jgi:tRNA dimethylallyltransferase